MSNLTNRNLKIIQARDRGATYQKIADLFGLSRERVRQIVVQSVLEEEQKLSNSCRAQMAYLHDPDYR